MQLQRVAARVMASAAFLTSYFAADCSAVAIERESASGNTNPAVTVRHPQKGKKSQPAGRGGQSVSNRGVAAEAHRMSEAVNEAEVLKEQLAQQQQEIAELRKALDEQKQMLQQAHRTLPGSSPQTPNLGQVASLHAVVPARQKDLMASARPDSLPAAVKPQNGAEASGPPSDLEVVKGELEAVADNASQANQRLAKLEKEIGAASLLAGWTGSHPYIRSKDRNFEMEFGGRLQFDWRSYTGTTTPPSSFFIRRARLEAGGQLFKHYEYKVQADFADTGNTLLRDGFVNINYVKGAQFQFGQFKAPFSQEELQSSKYIDFVERSSVNNLAPGRTPGLMFHGELLEGALEYYAGAFNGRKELGANNSSTPEGYLRLRFNPFKRSGQALFRNFSFGGAFADGRHKNDTSFRGRTASQSIVFFKPVPVNGEIIRANGEFWWRYRSFSVRGEYDQTHQYRENQCTNGTNCPGVIGKGLVLQATYLLTGEEKTETGITPKINFLGGQRGLGAWELAFRYENLQMHDSVNPNRAEAFTFGVNWWLTKFVRYQSNFVLERFKDPARAATRGQTDHFGYLSRMQVIF